MKVLLLFITISMCLFCCSSAAGDYTLVSADEVQKSSVILSLADFGCFYVVRQAIAGGKLAKTDCDFDVYKIRSVYQQVAGSTNYKYNVKLVNSETKTVINAVYVISYQAWTKARKVISSDYKVATAK